MICIYLKLLIVIDWPSINGVYWNAEVMDIVWASVGPAKCSHWSERPCKQWPPSPWRMWWFDASFWAFLCSISGFPHFSHFRSAFPLQPIATSFSFHAIAASKVLPAQRRSRYENYNFQRAERTKLTSHTQNGTEKDLEEKMYILQSSNMI